MQFELKNTAKSGRVVYTAAGTPKEIKKGETRNIDLTDGQAMNLKRMADQGSTLLIKAKSEDAQAVLDRAAYRIHKNPNDRRLPPPNTDKLAVALAPAIEIKDELVESPQRTFEEEFGEKPRRGRK